MEIVTLHLTHFVGHVHMLLHMPTVIYLAVIALFFGLITKHFAGVIFIPVLATAIFIAATLIGPVVLGHGQLAMPALNLAFAKEAAADYVVFLVLDTVVFGVKSLVSAIVDR